ncbi:MAG: lectin like domain-containing protein [Clostridiaceae bacterium]
MKNSLSKRKIAICLAAAFASFSVVSSSTGIVLAATGEQTLKTAPMNEDFTKYINGGSKQSYMDEASRSLYNTGEYTSGLTPTPFKISQGSPDIVTAALPSKFDLRGIPGKLSPIRNQGNSGSCWAFATYGSLESVLRPRVVTDYSENNMKNNSGFDLPANGGGNQLMSTAYLARWSGPVAETADPYNAASTVSKTYAAQSHVQNVMYLPDRKNALDNSLIKSAIMNYGGVFTSMLYSEKSYVAKNSAYFLGLKGYNANHGVDIIGWDDNFDRNKFYDANSRTKPAGNGAFICRNSWGTSFGQGGYFYISYYDAYIGKSLSVFAGAEAVNNYSSVYQYDTLGLVSSLGYSSKTAWFANVYTAKATKNVAAASFYTVVPNSTYEVYVVNNYTGPNSLTSSRKLVKTGKIAFAGYNTVKFNTLVPVTAGKKFAVVVKITTSGSSEENYYPIPIEYAVRGYSSKATAAPGQSYVGYNGSSWEDLTSYEDTANVTLKAFTK